MLTNKPIKTFLVLCGTLLSNNCQSFITNVFYPELDFGCKSKSKIAINFTGELFLLAFDREGNSSWSQDYKPFEALNCWPRLTKENSSLKDLFNLVLRQTLASAATAKATEFATMAFVIQNLCFLSEMLAWDKVFFASSLNGSPVFYDGPPFSSQQQIQVKLESAREYANVAAQISPENLPLNYSKLPCSHILSRWGYLFLLQQSASFYHQYIRDVSLKMQQFSESPYQDRLLAPIRCNDTDWFNLNLLLKYAVNISLPAAHKTEFCEVKQQIASAYRPNHFPQPLPNPGYPQYTVVPTRNDHGIKIKKTAKLLWQKLKNWFKLP